MRISERIIMINAILCGLSPSQVEQTRAVLIKSPDLELRAIHYRRASFALGAPVPIR